jgi:hypothetical protein
MEKETPHPSKLPSAQQTFRPFDRYDSLNGIAAKLPPFSPGAADATP